MAVFEGKENKEFELKNEGKKAAMEAALIYDSFEEQIVIDAQVEDYRKKLKKFYKKSTFLICVIVLIVFAIIGLIVFSVDVVKHIQILNVIRANQKGLSVDEIDQLRLEEMARYNELMYIEMIVILSACAFPATGAVVVKARMKGYTSYVEYHGKDIEKSYRKILHRKLACKTKIEGMLKEMDQVEENLQPAKPIFTEVREKLSKALAVLDEVDITEE